MGHYMCLMAKPTPRSSFQIKEMRANSGCQEIHLHPGSLLHLEADSGRAEPSDGVSRIQGFWRLHDLCFLTRRQKPVILRDPLSLPSAPLGAFGHSLPLPPLETKGRKERHCHRPRIKFPQRSFCGSAFSFTFGFLWRVGGRMSER